MTEFYKIEKNKKMVEELEKEIKKYKSKREIIIIKKIFWNTIGL